MTTTPMSPAELLEKLREQAIWEPVDGSNAKLVFTHDAKQALALLTAQFDAHAKKARVTGIIDFIEAFSGEAPQEIVDKMWDLFNTNDPTIGTPREYFSRSERDAHGRAEREKAKSVAASLAAAISLLERGGKKAAPSDKMFTIMLDDYRKSLNDYRAALQERAHDE